MLSLVVISHSLRSVGVHGRGDARGEQTRLATPWPRRERLERDDLHGRAVDLVVGVAQPLAVVVQPRNPAVARTSTRRPRVDMLVEPQLCVEDVGESSAVGLRQRPDASVS